jgi:hypothetical protein
VRNLKDTVQKQLLDKRIHGCLASNFDFGFKPLKRGDERVYARRFFSSSVTREENEAHAKTLNAESLEIIMFVDKTHLNNIGSKHAKPIIVTLAVFRGDIRRLVCTHRLSYS